MCLSGGKLSRALQSREVREERESVPELTVKQNKSWWVSSYSFTHTHKRVESFTANTEYYNPFLLTSPTYSSYFTPHSLHLYISHTPICHSPGSWQWTHGRRRSHMSTTLLRPSAMISCPWWSGPSLSTLPGPPLCHPPPSSPHYHQILSLGWVVLASQVLRKSFMND